MIGLDTNVVLRYFLQDDAAHSALATRLIDKHLAAHSPGHISLVTLAELVWVMRQRIKADRATVVRVLQLLLTATHFKVQEADVVWATLDLYQQTSFDFGDVLIAALDRSEGCTHTATFDKKASKLPGMQLLN